MDKRLSFEETIERHKGLLYKVVNIYCRNEDDKNDLLQEIKIQLWKSFDRYNADYKLSTWIYRIALNVAISFYRKNEARINRTVSLEENETAIEISENFEKDARLRLLEKFIGELSELDKALMILYLDGKNQSEIAEILGISATNVSTKIGRIKEKLKERFINESR